MSPRAGHGHHSKRGLREGAVVRVRAVSRPAPPEPEHRSPAQHSPAIPIAEAYLREWLENDEELAQLRFERLHGVLW